jgi:hypothetical protein
VRWLFQKKGKSHGFALWWLARILVRAYAYVGSNFDVLIFSVVMRIAMDHLVEKNNCQKDHRHHRAQ